MRLFRDRTRDLRNIDLLITTSGRGHISGLLEIGFVITTFGCTHISDLLQIGFMIKIFAGHEVWYLTTNMAEVVGTVASVLTLTVFTYDTSKTLYEAVASFKSHRKAVKEVQADLASLMAVLDSIRDQMQQSDNTAKFEPLRQPLGCCSTVCQELQEMLKVCTAHSKQDSDSIRDWLSMRYREKSFDDVKKRLASYKSTLCIAFALVNR